jgi:hypothetical protein
MCYEFLYSITRKLYLIPRKRVLLEKLPVSQLVNNTHGLYNTKIQLAAGLEDKFCVKGK